MATLKLSGSGARRTPRTTPRHTWTLDQKRCLLLLNARLNLEPVEITATFNKIFQAEIDPAGFPGGIPWRSLQAQYREHSRADNVGWMKITQPDSWDAELARRDELIERIQDCLPTNAAKRADRQTPERTTSASSEPRTPIVGCKRTHGALASNGSDDEIWSPSKSRKTVAVVVLRSESHAARTEVLADMRARGELTHFAPEPRTPLRSPKKTVMPSGFTRTGLLQPLGYHLFKRPHGPPIWLTPAELARARKGWISPSEQEAHPPLAGLFFRSVFIDLTK